ncbi:hypothetical protein MSPP1_002470 [Malassezia sp. CBS 17886]|nr:hypothetical protein MSPP1_002470 [Malassezia sp. CBS 17886]
MRESNFSNASQNRACVSVSTVVYDRRALDCTATLPLVNSLNHFAYLASTSPRIREMVTLDGGLERLVHILRSSPRRALRAQRTPHAVRDLHQNWKWSLAFQCLVNIGVRGSEAIRTRVVEAGMVPIIIRVLETYLHAAESVREEQALAQGAPKLECATALPLQATRAEPQEMRRTIYPSMVQEDAPGNDPARRSVPRMQQALGFDHTISAAVSRLESELSSPMDVESVDASALPDDRVADSTAARADAARTPLHREHMQSVSDAIGEHPAPARDASAASESPSTVPAVRMESTTTFASTCWPSDTDAAYETAPSTSEQRHVDCADYVVGSAGDASASGSASECAEDTEMLADDAEMADEPVVLAADGMLPAGKTEDHGTPRPTRTGTASSDARSAALDTQRARGVSPTRADADRARTPRAAPAPVSAERWASVDASPREPAAPEDRRAAGRDAGAAAVQMYREEEVLLSLQLLAYLSKYPHVRLFFHNTDVRGDMIFCPDWPDDDVPNTSWSPSDPAKQNVFSVAERFTLRPSRNSANSSLLSSLYPRLAPEIQYWAGVVMRNACRKDESRGGIRQCANMLCGKWESYPREFAKCRRCRKAKYCSKQCQSKGWQMGHRFWCSARSDESDSRDRHRPDAARATLHDAAADAPGAAPPAPMPDVDMEPARATPAHEMASAPAHTLPARESARDARADAAATPPSSAGRARDYVHPLGQRAVPSVLRTSQHMPQLRGVSAASEETVDVSDASDDGIRLELSSGAPSPAPDVGLTARIPGARPLPPPIIAGSIDVQEADPAMETLRAQETQDVQDHGVLEVIAASWPRNARAGGAFRGDARLRDTAQPPDASRVQDTGEPADAHGAPQGGSAAAEPGLAARARAQPPWHMARLLSFRATGGRAARAVSSSLLSNSFSASDLELDRTSADASRIPWRMSGAGSLSQESLDASDAADARIADPYPPTTQLFAGLAGPSARDDASHSASDVNVSIP